MPQADRKDPSRTSDKDETIVESTTHAHGDVQEASYVLYFWASHETLDRKELQAYLRSYKLEETTTTIDFWSVDAHVMHVELVGFGVPKSNSHDGLLPCGHRYGHHAEARGSALVHDLPDQGHVVGETRVSEDTHSMRADHTTSTARALLTGNPDPLADRHVWVNSRIRQGQPDDHGSHLDRDLGLRGNDEGPRAPNPLPFLVKGQLKSSNTLK
jgi:hypothetical protein